MPVSATNPLRTRSTDAHLATSRSIAALLAQPSFPDGTGIVRPVVAVGSAVSSSLAESAAWATLQKSVARRRGRRAVGGLRGLDPGSGGRV
jgi:hypothetical protein